MYYLVRKIGTEPPEFLRGDHVGFGADQWSVELWRAKVLNKNTVASFELPDGARLTELEILPTVER
jgi:hypothetical protein